MTEPKTGTIHVLTNHTPASRAPFLVFLPQSEEEPRSPYNSALYDSNTPMSVKALIDSGATGLFIDIEYHSVQGHMDTMSTQSNPVQNLMWVGTSQS